MANILAQAYKRARKQFGDDVKGFWFYDEEPCPGCGFPVDAIDYEGDTALSLNVFIYRPRGILIGYTLCSRCVQQIFDAIAADPTIQTTPLHGIIEQNLIKAYHRYLASLDA
ncbi:MAG: hypothetical protein ACP5UQ_04635 [Anaerolineae bacterium]